MPLTPMRVWEAIQEATEVQHDPRRVRLRRARLARRGASALLREGGEDAKLLAGGHSLLPLMKLRLAAPSLLVDLRKVPDLRGIQRDNGGVPDRRA